MLRKLNIISSVLTVILLITVVLMIGEPKLFSSADESAEGEGQGTDYRPAHIPKEGMLSGSQEKKAGGIILSGSADGNLYYKSTAEADGYVAAKPQEYRFDENVFDQTKLARGSYLDAKPGNKDHSWLEAKNGSSQSVAGLSQPWSSLRNSMAALLDQRARQSQRARAAGGRSGQASDDDSVSVRDLVGDSELSAADRVGALVEAPLDFSPDQVNQVFDVIQNGNPPFGIEQQDWHWLVDELVSSMRANQVSPETLTTKLTEVYSDTEQDIVVRDYALQHLGHLIDEGGEKEEIQPVLEKATKETEGTIAGTALLALYHNQADGSASEQAQPAMEALAIAKDPDYSVTSRITALQVAAQTEPSATAAFALETIEQENLPVSFRMAAIASLATTSQASAPATQTQIKQTLRQMQNDPNPRLAQSAKSAQSTLKKLSHR